MEIRRIVSAVILPLTMLVGAASARTAALDFRFGSGGVVITDTAPGTAADYQNGLEVQRDGKILVGGESDLGASAGGFQWRITRYTRNGAVDLTFGSGGTVLTSMSSVGGFDERLISLAVQRDGKIFAMALQGGSKLVASGECDQPTSGHDVCVVRYNLDDEDDDGR